MTSARDFVTRVGLVTTGDGEPALHRQIVERIVAAIDDGSLVAGEKLPAERDLASAWGVSRDTLRQALLGLQNRDRIARTVGRSGGTFVQFPKLAREVTSYAGLSRQLGGQQVAVESRVLSVSERMATPAIAAALKIESGAKVWEIHRLRFGDGKPIALEHTRYSAARLPGLLDHQLDGSLDELLEQRFQVRAEWATEYLEPILAGPDEVELLEVALGAPLLYIERISYTGDDEPLEFGQDIYRGDRTRVVAVSHRRPNPTGS